MKKLLLLLILTYFLLSCVQTGSELLIEEPRGTKLIYKPEEENLITHSDQNPPIEEETANQRGISFAPEKVIQAFKKAYPDKISEISYKNDDWAMKVYDTWYFWADGRMLPEELVLKKEDYNSHVFNRYPKELPPFQELPKDVKDRIDNILAEREDDPLLRHPGFLNSMWRIWDKETSWARVKTTYFLGYKLQVHRDILEDLARVEEEIQRRMLVDIELAAFVRSFTRIDGYNWRQIADTETLSVHSYGIALDLILKSPRDKEVYWLWTKNKGLKFYDQPYESRFSPPSSFIDAFENHGFIWGGKWLFFDTIHFEYRPEIMILNGLMD